MFQVVVHYQISNFRSNFTFEVITALAVCGANLAWILKIFARKPLKRMFQVQISNIRSTFIISEEQITLKKCEKETFLSFWMQVDHHKERGIHTNCI